MGFFQKKNTEGTAQSKSEADELVERLGATFAEKIEAAVKPIRDKVEGIATEWGALKDDATRSTEEERRRAAAAADADLTDEEKRAKRDQALLMATVLTNARITEDQVLREVASKWSHLIPKIQECFGSIPVEDKAKADYPARCRNAVKLIIGDEAMKSGLSYDRNTGKFLIEDAAARTGGEESVLNDPGLTWTDERTGKTLTATEQMRKLGITDEGKFTEYLKTQGVH
jgi:hypothetical protein